MDVTFSLQDPTNPATVYLYEAIVSAAQGASRWRGMYAFASRNGVDNLMGDPAIEEFLHAGGEADVVVGMDAITNQATLERLTHYEGVFAGFRPKVFWNAQKGLFHPKLSLFDYPDGRQTLIVGSGNLTPGGFKSNFEAYTVIAAAAGDGLETAEYDDFIARHAAVIRAIDAAALAEAAKNVTKVTKKPPAMPPALVLPVPPVAPPPAVPGTRVLIAQVPAAGGRWQQIHLNAAVIEQFFRVTNVEAQRVFLTPVTAAGRHEEEAREVVYSHRNLNYKIESSQGRGQAYPAQRPLIVYVERQLRTFDYQLIMPGAPGYDQLDALAAGKPSLGKGTRRVLATLGELAYAWPAAPLLAHPPVAAEGDV